MKITNLVLTLTLAGFSFSQASAQGLPYSAPAASRSIGDSGDADQYEGSATSRRNLSDGYLAPASAMDQSILAPTASSMANESGDGDESTYAGNDYQTASSYQAGSYAASCGECSTGDYGLAAACCGIGSSKFWLSAESLLWFSQGLSTPTLVTNAAFDQDPDFTNPNVTAVFGGGDGIEMGLLPGYRLSGGMYLGNDQKIGVGGRAYGIFAGSESYDQASNGLGAPDNPSIGVPFYNTFLNEEDSFVVAIADGGGLDVGGTVRSRVDLDMFGADGSLYLLLARTGGMRMDLLGGYTYNNLRSSVSVDTITTSFRFPTAGTNIVTNDLFETENQFHGAHLGVLSSVVQSRVSLSTLAKISFGNMRQTGSIRGSATLDDGVAPAIVNGAGILTQPSNIGDYSRDTFAFIPELGIKFGYAFSENVQLTAGYTVMMWSGVGLAGEQIDNTIDPTQLTLPNAGTRPLPLLNESTFWMQGLDLGVNFAF